MGRSDCIVGLVEGSGDAFFSLEMDQSEGCGHLELIKILLAEAVNAPLRIKKGRPFLQIHPVIQRVVLFVEKRLLNGVNAGVALDFRLLHETQRARRLSGIPVSGVERKEAAVEIERGVDDGVREDRKST